VTASTFANLVIGLVVFGVILTRQLQARPVKADLRLPLIPAVIGVIQLSQFMSHGRHGTEIWAVLLGSLVIAAALAGVRTATVHVWVDNDQAWRQGNWRTAVLWVASLGSHLGYDYLVDGRGANAGLGTATLTLYFAVTYPIQRVIVQARARNVAAAQQLDGDTHMTVRWP
jgi:putative effector of murein hydrolase LrgA (UPF0299 family)